MWPFRRKKKKEATSKRPSKVIKRLVVGAIIGGAIGSIIGKTVSEDGDVADDDVTDNTSGS